MNRLPAGGSEPSLERQSQQKKSSSGACRNQLQEGGTFLPVCVFIVNLDWFQSWSSVCYAQICPTLVAGWMLDARDGKQEQELLISSLARRNNNCQLERRHKRKDGQSQKPSVLPEHYRISIVVDVQQPQHDRVSMGIKLMNGPNDRKNGSGRSSRQCWW